MKSKTALYTLNVRKMTLTNIINNIMYMIYVMIAREWYTCMQVSAREFSAHRRSREGPVQTQFELDRALSWLLSGAGRPLWVASKLGLKKR